MYISNRKDRFEIRLKIIIQQRKNEANNYRT